MQTFADGVRHTHTPQAKSISQYHEFIRSNVHSVVTQTFPLFSQLITETTMEDWVTRFLLRSQAVEPEFHHIATEFVRFVQSENRTLPSQHVTVLEYEWVVFNTEINAERVTLPAVQLPKSFSAEWLFNCEIEINPTLQLIEVPFHIKNNEIDFINENEPLQAYAVYRNTMHQVLSQPLTTNDRLILASLYQYKSIRFEVLNSDVNDYLPINSIVNWIKHFNQTDLIRVKEVSDI
ncbi:putative DNA-binding domain-containing protein [Photobacterium makurazakiensis]|uniref:HvfC/BufC family peptide modification chaperone n=1 Tax=Photobacterium makurazakiensis TaxID=2910234 RepID=UPI003D0A6F65